MRGRPDILIEEVDAIEPVVAELSALIIDAVESGASIGFVLPLKVDEVTEWWLSLRPDVEAGRTTLLVAREAERIVGTAQLRLATMPNSRHRAEVAKLVVHSSARRRGIARRLMAELERIARREGRTQLVLDTISDSDAVHLYRALGWREAGSIPEYAAMPDGSLAPTTIFYRRL